MASAPNNFQRDSWEIYQESLLGQVRSRPFMQTQLSRQVQFNGDHKARAKQSNQGEQHHISLWQSVNTIILPHWSKDFSINTAQMRNPCTILYVQ